MKLLKDFMDSTNVIENLKSVYLHYQYIDNNPYYLLFIIFV